MSVVVDPWQAIIGVHWKKKKPDRRGDYYAILSSWPETPPTPDFLGFYYYWAMATRLVAPGGTRWTADETFYVGPYQNSLGIIDRIPAEGEPHLFLNRVLSGWRVDPYVGEPAVRDFSTGPDLIPVLPAQGQMKDYYLWAAEHGKPSTVNVGVVVDSCIINLGKIMTDFEGGFGANNDKTGLLAVQFVGLATGQHLRWDLRIFEPDQPVGPAPDAPFNVGYFSVVDGTGRLTYSTPESFRQEGRVIDNQVVLGLQTSFTF